MTKLDVAQTWIVEIFGTIIFLFAAINFIAPMVGQSAYVDITFSFIGLTVGLVLMGKRAIAEHLKNVIGR